MKTYDIIIAGGGMTGTAAAIAASRAGKKTLLIEQYGCLGGMATVGHVNPFMTYYRSQRAFPGQEVTAGIFQEILDRLELESEILTEYREEDGSVPKESKYKPRLWPGNVGFDTEALKWILDDMVLEAGGELRFHTMILDAEMSEGEVKTIQTASKSGLETFTARLFIDTTGDADLGFRAGFETEYGRKSDGRAQAMTTMFRMGDVDADNIPDNYDEYLHEAVKRGDVKDPGKKNLLMFPYPGQGCISFNQNEIADLDPTDADQLSEAEVRGRKAIREMVAFLKKDMPGFGNARVEQIAGQIGIRETRRIVGDFIMSVDDVVNASRFEDSIACGAFPVDIHDPEGKQNKNPMTPLPAGEYYQIPYRALIAKNSQNLLTAGRCLSATHEAAASIRVMPICTSLGQAAGEAAAMAVEENCCVSEINVASLQDRLKKAGAILD